MIVLFPISLLLNILVIHGLLLVITYGRLYDSSKSVLELKDRDLLEHQTDLISYRPLVLLLYSSWCGHCQKFVKPFHQQIETIDRQDHLVFLTSSQTRNESYASQLIVQFTAIDCVDFPTTCSKFQVKGYPSMRLFSIPTSKLSLNLSMNYIICIIDT